MGDDLPPLPAAAGAEVEGMIGRVHDVAIMLDDDERVAEVAELAEGGDQPVGVAGMETDRRLVEHVEHARQAAAHLRRQPDPLEFAPREAPRRPGHVEILKTHVDEKRHPREQLPQEIAGDFFFVRRECNRLQLRLQFAQRHPAPDVEFAAPERDGAGHVGKPATAALAAWHLAHHGVNLAPQGSHEPGRLLAGVFQALELVGKPGTAAGDAPRPRDFDPLVAGALEEHPLLQSRELRQRHVDRQARGRAEGLEHRAADLAAVFPVETRPEVERPGAERKRRIADQRRMLHAHAGAEAVATGAPAEGAVERKLPRLERLEAAAARWAGEPAAVHLDGPVGLQEGLAIVAVRRAGHEHRAAARLERRLDTLGETAPLGRLGRHAVDHDLDPTLPLAVERRLLVEVHRLAVDPHPHVARRPEPGKKTLGCLSDPQFDRRQQQEPRVRIVLQEPPNCLVDALRTHRGAAIGAMHHAEPRGEHPKIVIHLCERADGGARRAPGGPLLDRHRR